MACVLRVRKPTRGGFENFSFPGSDFANRERRHDHRVNGHTHGWIYLLLFPVSHGGDAGSFDDGPPNKRASGSDKEKRRGGKLDEARKYLRAVRKQEMLCVLRTLYVCVSARQVRWNAEEDE